MNSDIEKNVAEKYLQMIPRTNSWHELAEKAAIQSACREIALLTRKKTLEEAGMTRKFAQRLLADNKNCLIHGVSMEEYGVADLCGTFPTRCPECEKEK